MAADAGGCSRVVIIVACIFRHLPIFTTGVAVEEESSSPGIISQLIFLVVERKWEWR